MPEMCGQRGGGLGDTRSCLWPLWHAVLLDPEQALAMRQLQCFFPGIHEDPNQVRNVGDEVGPWEGLRLGSYFLQSGVW
jgi:hypothetical protein